ncbi:inositol monophosphatase family protein [Frondihabitans australicus]|uniref:Histidinol-phosphatase n=1 Tax=Frondihabitans australicus TaxID=386892 RepID=A0A495IEY6_9MICO|nr:inositol monophosphatase family protein [Frondihabitans australicus]RKR73725.1 histidinol-phosphate phosphatase [Frondihabitans australicus]
MTTSPSHSDDASYADDLALALRLADEADAISHARYRAADLDVSLKADHTHVTDADRAVERRIRDLLARERPDDAFFGEETGRTSIEGMPHRQWIVDPIDGTANFLRGVPVWATLVSLVVDSQPVVGVVSAPALGRRWWARAGGGAFVAEQSEGGAAVPRLLRVSAVSTLDAASLSYNGLQYWIKADRVPQLLALASQVWRTRAYGDFWSYMLVAEGAIDISGEFDLQPYDMAALDVIVREAGGRFGGIDGGDGIWHGSALATNGLLHEATLTALAK